MATEFIIYIVAWVSFCLFSGWLVYADNESFSFSHRGYFDFLFVRWKVATFIIAAIGISVIAPYTGDPTWDYFDALLMSLLTYLSAPWAVGTLYLVARRKLGLKHFAVAVCVWMLSASWCYDLYLVIRDGQYPITWDANIFASSVLYLSAGLFWNLEWKEVRGMTFSFMEEDWPSKARTSSFNKVFWYALPFMILAGGSIGYFLL